uniref:Galectin n=1 Tax=Callithrix jacchus TaxID=9483 RepID=A0A8I3X5F4_CALJA
MAVQFEAFCAGGLAPGWSLLVQGQADSGEDRFEINFLLETGDIAFHVKPRFSSATIVGNAFQGGCWGPEEVSSIFPLALGEPFEVTGAWVGPGPCRGHPWGNGAGGQGVQGGCLQVSRPGQGLGGPPWPQFPHLCSGCPLAWLPATPSWEKGGGFGLGALSHGTPGACQPVLPGDSLQAHPR